MMSPYTIILIEMKSKSLILKGTQGMMIANKSL